MNTFLIIASLIFTAPTADSNSPTATLTYNIADSQGVNIPGRLTFTDNDVRYWQEKAKKYYDKVHGTSNSPETSTTVNLDKNGTSTKTADIPF